jgi:thiol peroxidase
MATTTMSGQERQGGVTVKGKPLTLIGPQLNVGDKAPDFEVIGQDGTPITLSQFKGKPVLISVTTSLDTGICDAQTRRFNEEAAKLPNLEILNISMDLPYAHKRFCSTAGIDKVKSGSDHRDASFGRAYGRLIKELRLLARSIFLIDSSGTIRYVEHLPENAAHPNYDAALAAARQAK